MRVALPEQIGEPGRALDTRCSAHGRYRISRAARSRPPARARRRSARPRGSPRRAIAIATLARPPASASRRAARRPSTPPSSTTSRRARARSLAERRRQVDHAIAVDLAQANERGGGERVQGELGRGARLEPRGAGEDLRADREDHDQVRRSARDGGVTGQEDGARAAAARLGEGAPHEGRDTAGRDPHHDIPAPRAPPHLPPAGPRVVLGALARAEHRAPPAGDDRLHQGRRAPEGRRALGRLQHPEPPARARADQDEAAPAARWPAPPCPPPRRSAGAARSAAAIVRRSAAIIRPTTCRAVSRSRSGAPRPARSVAKRS